ncbi:hypothetical protein P8452_45062 [Trifolium repens]|nr:hypothetical protein P8452_45062 [Trifolium repens]
MSFIQTRHHLDRWGWRPEDGEEFSVKSTYDLVLHLFIARGSKQLRYGLIMIWNAVIWSVWCHRNKVIFDNVAVDCVGLVEEVKIASWKWWIGRSKAPSCLFYEWTMEPVICLNR